MNFAPSKCYTLSVTLKKEPSLFTYSLCKSILEGVKFQKYLGVYITSSLSWAKQCEAVKKKANRVLGVLQRSLSSCSESVKKKSLCGSCSPNSRIRSSPPELVSTVRRTRASQQHNRTFIHPCTSVDSYKYSFFVRTVPYWNSLPPSVINANSTTSFFSQVSNIYCH